MDPEDRTTTVSAQDFVDALLEPAVVFDRHLDVVAANGIAGAVSAALRVGTNLARSAFLESWDAESEEAWEAEAHRTVSMLRDSLQHHEADGRFRDLLGELMARSPAFATEWAAAPGRAAARGRSRFDNALVGELLLDWEQLARRTDREHVMLVWAPADPTSAGRLERLREGLTR